ncbi:hypothetical protein [Pseudonocardia humida]|nr:hypothetical protein [Pseudonocardia humida]
MESLGQTLDRIARETVTSNEANEQNRDEQARDVHEQAMTDLLDR